MGFLTIATQVCLDVLSTMVIALLFILKDKPEVVKRLGFRITQFDVPYDPFLGEQGMVMVVKTQPNKPGQVPVWILPQTTFTQDGPVWSSKDNGEELGLPVRLYAPKSVLGFFGASRTSLKGYRGSEVKVMFDLLLKNAEQGKISWHWNAKDCEFEIDSVEYSRARFLKPRDALALLKEEAEKGTRPNPKRAKAYAQALEALQKKFSHIEL